jgi:FtsZ-binding cell division protein ZapB
MDEKTIDAIHRLMTEISETKQKAKTVKDNLKDVLEQNDEYRALEDDLKELTTKRAAAKKVLQADKDYQLVSSELEELKFKLKDLQEILSHHLVTYYDESKKLQLKDADGEVRPVILSAKIGKPEAEINE